MGHCDQPLHLPPARLLPQADRGAPSRRRRCPPCMTGYGWAPRPAGRQPLLDRVRAVTRLRHPHRGLGSASASPTPLDRRTRVCGA
jgi:hypothetical protein